MSFKHVIKGKLKAHFIRSTEDRPTQAHHKLLFLRQPGLKPVLLSRANDSPGASMMKGLIPAFFFFL